MKPPDRVKRPGPGLPKWIQAPEVYRENESPGKMSARRTDAFPGACLKSIFESRKELIVSPKRRIHGSLRAGERA